MMQTVSGELRRSTKIDYTQINIKETHDAINQSRDSNNTHDHGFRASRDVPIAERRRTTSSAASRSHRRLQKLEQRHTVRFLQ
jgi:hypothetical protein